MDMNIYITLKHKYVLMWGMILYIQYTFCIMLALEGGEIEFQQWNSYLS